MVFKAVWAHALVNKNIDSKKLLKAVGDPLRQFLEDSGWEET
jgi:hypothetical protein